MEKQVLVPVTEEMYDALISILRVANVWFLDDINHNEMAIEIAKSESSYPDISMLEDFVSSSRYLSDMAGMIKRHFTEYCKFEDEK